jgi:hypothetical protein
MCVIHTLTGLLTQGNLHFPFEPGRRMQFTFLGCQHGKPKITYIPNFNLGGVRGSHFWAVNVANP